MGLSVCSEIRPGNIQHVKCTPTSLAVVQVVCLLKKKVEVRVDAISWDKIMRDFRPLYWRKAMKLFANLIY